MVIGDSVSVWGDKRMGINGGKPLLAQQFNRWRHMNHLPLSDAARGVTSAATLSRFESGQSMISSDVLGRLLVRLPVAPITLAADYAAVMGPADLFQQVITVFAQGESTAAQTAQIDEYWAQYRATQVMLYRLQATALAVIYQHPLTDQTAGALALQYLHTVRHYSTADLQATALLMPLLAAPERDLVLERILVNGDLADDALANLAALITCAGVVTALHDECGEQAAHWQRLAERLLSGTAPLDACCCVRTSGLLMQYHQGHRAAAQTGYHALQRLLVRADARGLGCLLALAWHYGRGEEKGRDEQ
jgi:transcriptional regulator with XRE-family HTH domain